MGSTGERQTNLELLRILSMFFVLILHANFGIIGVPEVSDFIGEDCLTSTLRVFVEFLAIGCVNIFILISGYFGLNFSINKLLNLGFQIMFFALVSLLITCSFSVKSLLELFCLDGSLWFVCSYLLLMFFAPILNSFVENANKHDLLLFILLFFSFQTIYGWIFHSVGFFLDGYSPISFMGLYLLGRYIKRHSGPLFRLDYRCDLYIYISTCVLMTFAVVLFARHGIFIGRLFSYINPLVIMSAVYLLLFFSKIKIGGKASVLKSIIFFFSSSSFAVYLFHGNANIYQYFVCVVQYLWECKFGFALIILFLLFVFFVAVCLDKIRLLSWKFICSFLEGK